MKHNARIALIISSLFLIAVLATSCMYGPGRTYGFEFFFGLPFSLIGLAIYVLPTIIAAVRHSRSLLGIILVNILLGWTFVGWVAALVWSLAGAAERR